MNKQEPGRLVKLKPASQYSGFSVWKLRQRK